MIINVKVDIKDHLFNNVDRNAFIKSVEVQLVEVCPSIVKLATAEYDKKNQYNPSVTFTATEEIVV